MIKLRPFLFALPFLTFASAAIAAFQPGAAVMIPSVSVFSASGANWANTPNLTMAGYYMPGDGGGGVLYALGAPGCTDNRGSILKDAASNCFYATAFPSSVLQWGARADAVIVKTSGTITSGSHTFVTTSPPPASMIGAPIGISGIGPSITTPQGTFVGPLFTTITAISGNNVTIADAAQASAPTCVQSGFNGPGVAGTGYVVGDTLTYADGSTGQVLTIDGSGGVVKSDVLTQVSVGAIPAQPQATSGGTGANYTATLRYTCTGQFWYGHDDGAIINAALAVAPLDTDLWLPANSIVGTTIPIILPAGNNSLRGWDINSSGIIALAGSMPELIDRPLNATLGGGMRDLYADAFKGATYTLFDSGGTAQTWDNVAAKNAISTEWNYGGGVSNSGNNDFNHIQGFTDSTVFGLISEMPSNDWLVSTHGNDSRVTFGVFHSAVIPVDDERFGNDQYDHSDIFGAPPYQPTYGIQDFGSSIYSDTQVGNSAIAAIHLEGFTTLVNGVLCQWNNSYSAASDCVLIDSGAAKNSVQNVIATNNLPSAQIVVQAGTADPTTIVCNNPNASYSACQTGPLLPMTAPAAPTKGWLLYVDSGDGNKLKAIYSTGTLVTLGTP